MNLPFSQYWPKYAYESNNSALDMCMKAIKDILIFYHLTLRGMIIMLDPHIMYVRKEGITYLDCIIYMNHTSHIMWAPFACN